MSKGNHMNQANSPQPGADERPNSVPRRVYAHDRRYCVRCGVCVAYFEHEIGVTGPAGRRVLLDTCGALETFYKCSRCDALPSSEGNKA